MFNLLLALSALLGTYVLVSLYRPSQSLAVPAPAKPVGRWLWFDRSIRYERWHPPRTVSGPSFSWGVSEISEFDLDHRVFLSGRNAMHSMTAYPNGTMVVQTFDYWQFNLWQAAECVAALTAVVAIASWKFRQGSPQRTGFCPTCGYDLRASTDRCPECGTPITANAEAKA